MGAAEHPDWRQSTWAPAQIHRFLPGDTFLHAWLSFSLLISEMGLRIIADFSRDGEGSVCKGLGDSSINASYDLCSWAWGNHTSVSPRLYHLEGREGT